MNFRSCIPQALLVVGISSELCVAQAPNSGNRTSVLESSIPDHAMAQGDDPACPGDGSCCVGHGAPGCNNTVCCNNVCAADLTCCLFWDSGCASLADVICGSVCAGSCPGVGDCCTAHSGGGCSNATCCDLVCLNRPSCCETGWTATCAALAVLVCNECEPVPTFVCPQPGECCTGRLFTGGCERSGCCETVCTRDDFCCNEEWDDVCANMANTFCHNVCDCAVFGNFDADTAINLRDAAEFLNCFSGIGSAPVPSACACADYDGDGDADLADFNVFAELLVP